MLQALADVTLVGFAAALFAAFVAWFAIIIFGFKAIRRVRPGVELWGRGTLWNPANVLLSPSLLTEEGLRYRHKCLVSIGVFIACVGIPLLIAAITGQLK